MPEKMTFAGENTLEAVVRVKNHRRDRMVIITRPTPSPRVAENAYRTLTIGTRHFAILSSLFFD